MGFPVIPMLVRRVILPLIDVEVCVIFLLYGQTAHQLSGQLGS